MALVVPLSDRELAARIAETVKQASAEAREWYIRMLLTRGIGDLTYDPAATPTPSVVIIVKPLRRPAG